MRTRQSTTYFRFNLLFPVMTLLLRPMSWHQNVQNYKSTVAWRVRNA